MSQRPSPHHQPLLQALQLALNCHQQGQLAQAEVLYGQVLQGLPTHPDALHYFGVLCLQTQRVDQGIALIQRSLAANPKQPSPYVNLGNALVMTGQLTQALATYDTAIRLLPAYAEAHSNRAHVLLSLSRPQEALLSADRALKLDPKMLEAHLIKGLALNALKRWAEALPAFDQTLRLAPGHLDALLNRGIALTSLRRHAEAEATFKAAIQAAPDHADAHSNLGVVLQEMGRLDEAMAAFRRAIELMPDHASAHLSLGVAHQERGESAQACQCFREALRLDPGLDLARSNLLFTLSYDPLCTPEMYLAEARAYGAAVTAKATPFPHDGRALKARSAPLRVGLLSGDLLSHPVGLFLQNLLPHISPDRLTLLAYPTQALEDEITATLKPHFATWRCLQGLDDAGAAALIHEDRPDLLLDLSGHTAHNRLPVMAWRPAPVQGNWLGFLASTGLPAIDFILADRISAPLVHQGHFTERIVHLPDTGNCFAPPPESPMLEVAPCPAMSRGHVTFGCYQNLAKISDDMLRAWSAILSALPTARLRIQNRQMTQAASRLALSERLARVGIALDRVDMAGGQPGRDEHLASHAEVDIMLDTFPYPGITTTCEALWMGVPTVTLLGQTMLSRQGGSLLTCVGLQEWVTESTQGYVDTAILMAGDVASLQALRANLRALAQGTSLFDGALFAEQLTSTLEQVWQAHIKHEPD
ncbi:MAG TPA: tetratricopeptide repeat protein [Aquabacterium sp.]|nr:tetratricopeptide repeat protein [Aquabacterium sp.]HRH29350.1 tetratricopeptide repeat protein [Aquabacterium sp.]